MKHVGELRSLVANFYGQLAFTTNSPPPFKVKSPSVSNLLDFTLFACTLNFASLKSKKKKNNNVEGISFTMM